MLPEKVTWIHVVAGIILGGIIAFIVIGTAICARAGC